MQGVPLFTINFPSQSPKRGLANDIAFIYERLNQLAHTDQFANGTRTRNVYAYHLQTDPLIYLLSMKG